MSWKPQHHAKALLGSAAAASEKAHVQHPLQDGSLGTTPSSSVEFNGALFPSHGEPQED